MAYLFYSFRLEERKFYFIAPLTLRRVRGFIRPSIPVLPFGLVPPMRSTVSRVPKSLFHSPILRGDCPCKTFGLSLLKISGRNANAATSTEERRGLTADQPTQARTFAYIFHAAATSRRNRSTHSRKLVVWLVKYVAASRTSAAALFVSPIAAVVSKIFRATFRVEEAAL